MNQITAAADGTAGGEPEGTLLTDSTVNGEPDSSLLIDTTVNGNPAGPLRLRHRKRRGWSIRSDSVRVRHTVPADDDDDDREPGSCWYCDWKTLVTKKSCKDYWTRFLPCQQWLFQYSLKTFWCDLAAGVTVAVMAIPLSMSYAKLAGLPASYGLYATFIPPFVYAVFGTSRQLAVGPAALVSLLLSSGLTPIVEGEGFATDSDEYVARYTTLAIQSSFLAGLIMLVMGIFQLGFVTQFLSRSLISGFTSGAAIIIATSQIKYIFGYSIPSSDRIYELIRSLIENISQFNWKTFVMGSLSILLLVATKSMSEKFPKYKWIKAIGPLLVTIVAIVLTVTLGLEQRGIPLVDNIPKGLPSVTVDLWTPLSMDLWVPVLAMVVVGFVQSIAIAKRLAYKHSYEIDSSQELVALGMSNLVGGMFQSFPVAGALGQTAANDDIGAQTGLASVVTAAIVMLVLLFLASVFSKMPLSVLGAIVISFVLAMFDFKEAVYLWRVHKFDFSVWMVAFFGTMLFGVTIGLSIAVVISILIVIYESAYPHTAVLGRLPDTRIFRNIKQYPAAECYDGLVMMRIDSSLYFANAQNFRDKVNKYKRVAADELFARNGGEVKYLLLEMSPMPHIDTTALHVLEDMHLTQKMLGVQMCYANPGIKVMTRLMNSGLLDLIGREHVFSSMIDAVDWCFSDMNHEAQDVIDQEAPAHNDAE